MSVIAPKFLICILIFYRNCLKSSKSYQSHVVGLSIAGLGKEAYGDKASENSVGNRFAAIVYEWRTGA